MEMEKILNGFLFIWAIIIVCLANYRPELFHGSYAYVLGIITFGAITAMSFAFDPRKKK